MGEPVGAVVADPPRSDEPTPGPTQERRRVAIVLVVLVLAAAASGAALVARARTAPSGAAAAPTVPLGNVAVQRTDVAERQQVPGTLGYAGGMTVVSELAGTVTRVAAPGQVVRAGQEVAEVDGRPVVLMLGARPAWRGLAVGMPDGPDVGQLEQNLRRLGFDPRHAMTVEDHFSSATAAAVRRWQATLHVPLTGVVGLGTVAFLPSELRVTADDSSPGALVSPGQRLVSGTTDIHDVTVALDTGRQGLVHVGDGVVVTLQDGRTTIRAVVASVGDVATGGGSGGQGGAGAGGGGGGGGTVPTIDVTVRLLDQAAAGRLDEAPVQVDITDERHVHVLAVPVTALIATAGGGYAVTRPDGSPVPVTVGLFDDLTQLVEVSGAGLAVGDPVQVPLT
jgi:peptidoglycan hydrolase-like protein with peptidoglycan-binding domain